MKPCECSETRISFAREDGVASIAPVTFRCNLHRNERRAMDRAKAAIVAQFDRAVARLQPALPAPLRLLAQSTEGSR